MNIHLDNKWRLGLGISLAVNIFAIAFICGRLTGDNLPYTKKDFPRPERMIPREVLDDVMRGKQDVMKKHFDAIRNARKKLSENLISGKVSAEELEKYFTEIDASMFEMKNEFKKTIIAKIAKMSDEDRIKFAKSLVEDPHDLNRGHGKGDKFEGDVPPPLPPPPHDFDDNRSFDAPPPPPHD